MNRKISTNIENDFFLAHWMAGEITDKELMDLVSLEDYTAYKKIEQSLSQKEAPEFDVEKGFKELLSKLDVVKAKPNNSKVKPLVPKWFYLAAASIALLFGVIFQFYNTTSTFKTSFGEQSELTLGDGSDVVLNAKSTLTYKKNWSFNRDVFLEGEAFFKITKGDRFDVKTSQGTISVLGTQFNVISRKGLFEVVCYEGKVAVTYQNNRILLLPGKAYRVIDEKVVNWETTKDSSTWHSGISSFNSVPLKHVLVALQNEYNIIIDKNGIDDTILFTGSFKHHDLKSAIESIAFLLNVDYEIIDNDKIILLNK
jgi:ferric-dicitrate binding protein FerR (iron transport regulator)